MQYNLGIRIVSLVDSWSGFMQEMDLYHLCFTEF